MVVFVNVVAVNVKADAVKKKDAVLIAANVVNVVPIVVKMVVVVEEGVAQSKDVAVVVKMDVVLEDVALFATVFVLLEDVAMILVVQRDVVLVLIIKKFY